MAEALGVVASGIAVTQLAAQVTSSIIKLKNYWDQIKDVPSEIAILLREIDALNLVLCHIQGDQGTPSDPTSVSNSVYLKQSLELCQQGSAELGILVNELAAKIEGKRGLRKKIGSAKVMLRDEETKKLKRRMKSAIRLLSLSYQCHSSAMIQLHTDAVVTRLSNHITSVVIPKATPDVVIIDSRVPGQISLAAESSKELYHGRTNASPWFHFLVGDFEYRKRNRKYKGKEREELYAKFKLPDWVSHTAWDIHAHNTMSAWRFSLRTYRSIHAGLPFFEAVRKRDVGKVRELLLNHEAFITDRTSTAWTYKYSDLKHNRYKTTLYPGTAALHISALNGDIEMSRLLLYMGADPLVLDDNDQSPLHCFVSHASYLSFRCKEDVMSMLRLLLRNGASELLIEDTEILRRTNSPVDLFCFLQEEMYPPFFTLPLKTRIDILVKQTRMGWHNAPLLLQSSLLNGSCIDPAVLNWTNRQGQAFLHLIAENFAGIMFQIVDPVLDNSLSLEVVKQLRASKSNGFLWRELIIKFITAGAQLHTLDSNGLTPFRMVFSGLTLWNQSQPIHAAVSAWLEDLVCCGVALQEYGVKEHHILKQNDLQDISCYYVKPDTTVQLRLINFTYGPRPCDWRFYFSEPTDYLAGEFWSMIEAESDANQEPLELAMPGSWTDVDDV